MGSIILSISDCLKTVSRLPDTHDDVIYNHFLNLTTEAVIT